MSNNFFNGQIPCFLSIDYLIDLSHNRLSGSLTSCSDPFKNVEHLVLQGNKLRGPLPIIAFGLSSLVTLDIRDNRFSGKIPNEIGRLSDLRVLC